MPAVYKSPDSKIYWTAWRDEAGKLYRKSSRCTNRSQAEKAAAAMSAAFRRRKVSAHVREVCLNFHREATGEAMPETSLRAYAETWLATKKNEVSTLSLQFTNILAAVDLREAVTHQSAKKGRDTSREVATVSFHSLRHSAVSLLKAAGVPDATVMALVGHETLAMSSHYTHVGKESLESAVASLPSFVLVPSSDQQEVDSSR